MGLFGKWYVVEFSAFAVLQWCGLESIAVDLLVDPIDIASHNRPRVALLNGDLRLR